MAKKKSRSANVARKREKRNRRQKTKQKQLASEKQRKMQYSKLDEEGLFDLLLHSREFCREPEFENIHFDLELTQDETVGFFMEVGIRLQSDFIDEESIELVDIDSVNEDLDDEILSQFTDDFEDFCDDYFTSVIQKLITPELILNVRNALSICEKRFRRIGDRYQADAAFVSNSFFDAVSTDKYGEHPIFEGILIKTFSQILEQPLDSTKQTLETIANYGKEIASQTSDASDEGFSSIYLDVVDDEDELTDDLIETEVVEGFIPNYFDSNQDMELFTPSAEEYPAKALYKNCVGIRLPELLQQLQVSKDLNGDTPNVHELLQELETYITVSEDRLHIYARNEDELSIVMEKMEEHCQSSIMFLAKTIDEGGSTDGTE